MTDTDRLHEIADLMDEHGFGRGDTADAPHVREAAARIVILRGELASAKAEAELYRRAYDLIGACDISNFLALCQLAGNIGEPVLHDLWERMKIEKEYRESHK